MSFIHSKPFKYSFFIAVLVIAVFILGRNLSPFSGRMFTGHDETQAARISEFTYNLDLGKIPPRIAPHFSYGLGYPIFNFYAPFSYWVTSGINTFVRDIPVSLKLSYMLAIAVGFAGMTLYLRKFFSLYASILGSLAYISSPYIAVEIFVRGNLAEMWFLALFPLGLYVLHETSKKRILLNALILSALFTSHNILSLLSVGIIIVYSFFLKNKLLNILTIISALLLSAYFLIPSILELGFVNASMIATKTVYTDHFLCLNQIWQSQPGFAGSAAGCENDGMSFMLGKINILFGIAGLGLFVYQIIKKQQIQNKSIYILFTLITIGSIFMTLELSSFIWKLTEKISALFQFPWRFLAFALFGTAVFAAFGFERIQNKYKLGVLVVGIIALLYFNHDHFYGQYLSASAFKKQYISSEYISTVAPYKVAEYLPRNADYGYWNSLQGSKNVISGTSPVVQLPRQELLMFTSEPFYKLFMAKSAHDIIANIHYAPYWDIQVNNKKFQPLEFDKLGRPYINVSPVDYDSVAIRFAETQTEKAGNTVTILTALVLVLFTVMQFKIPWKIKVKKL
jgi:hypothetical protein